MFSRKLFYFKNSYDFMPPETHGIVSELYLSSKTWRKLEWSLIYGVNLRIHPEYRKIPTKKTPYLDTFHALQFSMPFHEFLLFDYSVFWTQISKRRGNMKIKLWSEVTHRTVGLAINQVFNTISSSNFSSRSIFMPISTLNGILTDVWFTRK